MVRAALLAALAFGTLAASASETPLQVFMAGDSTMSIKLEKDYPETGWGVPFSIFFDEQVSVHNFAKNGRSTRTFREEGLWQQIMDGVKSDDFVFIQFGHNDQSEHKKDRYTPPEAYKYNLRRFISEARSRGARPILMTPVTRRYFTTKGVIEPTHRGYDDLVREVAQAEQVPFIDMEKVTRHYFTAMGDEASKLRFMHIAPDLHPNYPIGVTDDTHFNHLGAREVAQLVLRELKAMQHPLAQRLRTPDPKHLQR
ncbi:rhamnogalacturonan acetylesterase [Gilvimarinus sp. SDUM040013]|uniref:Rhamnogalacturonan acetylesterase n=1 Tax=Gilvimarinus gilvus TaxID=3058038 RepID=A0ABU4RXU7_9GAMM|nr:rhamnogalacturonan acetylesterase [Gilvimarinus sp. SDUM040013]MDO3386453.1 rhamnogalacturonan acetylesterase [Gilvimarinus sp. SDUM040013]MDX6849719.1 rhamnogalacturonan acetylesterase [Gilvimarinus sp. SDUM040013]